MKEETIRFSVTREKLEEARFRLASSGFDINGDVGYTEHKGFGVRYVYCENVLTLTLTKKPMLVPVSMVRKALIKKMLEEGVSEV